MSLDPNAIPEQLDFDDSPGDLTFYFGIDLHNGLAASQSKTAVYCPDSMQAGLDITLVLYLQGYTNSSLTPIDVFLKNTDFKLREEIKKPKKGAFVFVAPTLRGVLSADGKKSAQAGDLATDPDSYLKQVMNGLHKHGPFGAVPTVKKIVLAAHSAGGQWILPIANKLADRIFEVWCFDCLYWGGDWISWIRRNTQCKRFFAYSFDDGTRANTQAIKDQARDKLPSVEVALRPDLWQNIRPPNHDQVPLTFLKNLVETSSVLS